jgi:hypothetical protein
MFSRIHVGDTSFHFKSLERFANSTDSGRNGDYSPYYQNQGKYTGVTGGKVNSFEFNYTLGGGYGIEVGIVTDSKGASSWFLSHGPSLGLSFSLGFAEKSIRPNNGKNFLLSDYPGYSSGWSFGLGVAGGEWAGNRRNTTYKNTDLYKTGDDYNQIGFGSFYGFNLGGSWSRTITTLY